MGIVVFVARFHLKPIQMINGFYLEVHKHREVIMYNVRQLSKSQPKYVLFMSYVLELFKKLFFIKKTYVFSCYIYLLLKTHFC